MPLVTAAVAEVVAVDSKHLTRNVLFGLAALREVGALTCMSPSEWLSDLILIDHATKRDNPLGYLDRGSYPGRNFHLEDSGACRAPSNVGLRDTP